MSLKNTVIFYNKNRQGNEKKGSIQKRVIASILLVGTIPGIIVVALACLTSISTLKQSIGMNFQEMAKEAANKINLLLDREIQEAKSLALSSDVRVAVLKANQLYEGKGEGEIQLQNLSHQINSSLSNYLEEYQNSKPDEYNSIFVTDRTGIIIAGTERAEASYQGKENWWNKALNNGSGKILISGIEYDDRTQSNFISIAVPVMNGGRVAGILKMIYKADELFSEITGIRIGETGHANLVTSDGTLIVCPIFPPKSHTINEHLMRQIGSDKPGWGIADDDAHGGKNSIIGFAPVDLTITMGQDNFEGKRWHIFIRQLPYETYAPIYTLLWEILFLEIAFIVLLFILGYYTARRIIKPIGILTEGAELIGSGNLNHRIIVKTNDEIERLAETFNRMAENLEKGIREREGFLHQIKELGLYNTLFNSAEDSLLMVNQEREIGAVNKREEKVIGYPRDLLIGQDFSAILQEGDRGLFSCLLNETLEGEKPPTVEIRVVSRDGRPIPMEMDMTAVKKDDGIAFVLIHLRDISRRKELEQQLLKSERLSTLSLFSSALAHDLRNPIIGIKKRLESIQNAVGVSNTEEIKGVLTDIISGIEFLLVMVNDVLDVYRDSYEDLPLIISTFPFVEAVEDAIKLLHIEAEERRIQVCLTDNRSITIQGDKMRLQRVFINLLHNALKYSPHDSKVDITFNPVSADNTDYILFKIEDEGTGIPPSEFSRIFEPFHQKEKKKEGIGGIGLGLYFCKVVVEAHGGAIWAENGKKNGAAFYIKFPLGEKK
ncbi:MAG: PAS domain S-box protein [Nitrospinae bacterium]|nr:PAS domain S-box protein [Nitrospinota bacterium]